MAESYFSDLAGYECICLTTFRKNGEAVPTPVWFAESDGKLYVFTARSSGKVKRIRNNASVTVRRVNSMARFLARQSKPGYVSYSQKNIPPQTVCSTGNMA